MLLFCTEEQHETFLQQAPQFERLLVHEGIALTKFWFSVTPGEQHTRFAIRQIDPVRQWKLSPTDIALLDKWDEYTAAKVSMFQRTDTPEAPWTVVKSNDKKRARLEAMRSLLAGIDYDRARFLSLLRSEEHTSELQSQSNLVCRLLLEK